MTRGTIGLGGSALVVARTFAAPLAIIAVQQVLFPMPAGILVRGAIVGAVTALVALGMALIYRANRIINFAQGDLGAAPAVLVYLLLTQWGWPYPLAVASGAVTAFVLGGVVELSVIRRFSRAPRLVLTVATIGVAQLLAGVGLLLPVWFDTRILAPRIAEPFEFKMTVGQVIFRANSLLAIVAAPIAVVGLIVFLRGTKLGIAIRASADRSDRASLLGIPVGRLQTLVWAIAGLLAFVATFFRAGLVGLPVGTALGLGLLLRSLTALLLGGMTNLPVIGLSSIALGILELSVDWNQGKTIPFTDMAYPPIDLLLLIVVAVSIMLRRRSGGRTTLEETSSWQAADEVRPIPTELAGLWPVRVARAALAVVGTTAVLALPHFLRVDQALKASALLVYAILGMSLVVLTGWAGQVSLGQIAFFAIGAAVGGKLSLSTTADLSLVVIASGVVGAVVAVIVGLPALRLRGLYLAVTSFAFALATTSFFLDTQYFDWIPTRRIPRHPLFGRIDITSSTSYYYVTLAWLVVLLVGLKGIRASRTGRVLLALRDNERAAQAYGISAVRIRLTAFAISGFVAAAAGCLFVHLQRSLGQGPYGPGENLAIFAQVVVGGITSLPGAVLGALYFQGSQWFLPLNWQVLASGLGVLVVLMVLPAGLGGLVYTIRDQLLRTLAIRWGIHVPSLLEDRRTEHDEPEGRPLPGRRPVTETDHAPPMAPGASDGPVERDTVTEVRP